MDHSKLELLTQVRIEKPCSKDWNEMSGDETCRHCVTCSLSVNNIAEMSATEAEELLSSGGHVCVRLTVDDQQNLLTRDGWIPRMVLAGAVAATLTGCGQASKSVAVTTSPSNIEIAKDKFVEVGTEAYYKVFPNARPVVHSRVMVTMGAVESTSYLRSGSKITSSP